MLFVSEINRQDKSDVYQMGARLHQPVPCVSRERAALPVQRGDVVRHVAAPLPDLQAGRRLLGAHMQDEGDQEPPLQMDNWRRRLQHKRVCILSLWSAFSNSVARRFPQSLSLRHNGTSGRRSQLLWRFPVRVLVT